MTTKCRRQILLSLSGGVLRGTWALLVGILLLWLWSPTLVKAQVLLNPPVLVKAGSTLQWSPVAGVEGYVISCGISSAVYTAKTFVAGSATSVVITAGLLTMPGGSLPSGESSHFCVIQAQNITGSGPVSAEVSFTLPAVPLIVTNFRVVP